MHRAILVRAVLIPIVCCVCLPSTLIPIFRIDYAMAACDTTERIFATKSSIILFVLILSHHSFVSLGVFFGLFFLPLPRPTLTAAAHTSLCPFPATAAMKAFPDTLSRLQGTTGSLRT